MYAYSSWHGIICGNQPGHPQCLRQPFGPDQVIKYELTDKDARGFVPLDEWFILQHIAPMPEVIRKGGLLGADTTAAAAFMKGSCHLSYTTMQQFFKEMMNLDLSRGMLCKAAQKISAALKSAYDHLVDRLPHGSQVNVDGAGHH
jgi:hypothetical protein